MASIGSAPSGFSSADSGIRGFPTADWLTRSSAGGSRPPAGSRAGGLTSAAGPTTGSTGIAWAPAGSPEAALFSADMPPGVGSAGISWAAATEGSVAGSGAIGWPAAGSATPIGSGANWAATGSGAANWAGTGSAAGALGSESGRGGPNLTAVGKPEIVLSAGNSGTKASPTGGTARAAPGSDVMGETEIFGGMTKGYGLGGGGGGGARGADTVGPFSEASEG